MSENEIEAKPAPEKDPETGRFLTGNIGGGRPKGSRNVLGEKFVTDLQELWQEHGKDALLELRHDKPAEFVRAVISVIPKELQVNVNPLEELTDEQLAERIRALEAEIRPFLEIENARTINGSATRTEEE